MLIDVIIRKNISQEINDKQMFACNKIFEIYNKMWYYVVDTTLIGGTKSGSEDSSFNTLLMCVSFFFLNFYNSLLIDLI